MPVGCGDLASRPRQLQVLIGSQPRPGGHKTHNSRSVAWCRCRSRRPRHRPTPISGQFAAADVLRHIVRKREGNEKTAVSAISTAVRGAVDSATSPVSLRRSRQTTSAFLPVRLADSWSRFRQARVVPELLDLKFFDSVNPVQVYFVMERLCIALAGQDMHKSRSVAGPRKVN